MIGSYLTENNVKVKDGTDVNTIIRDIMSVILEGVLDEEMKEGLEYPKYYYRHRSSAVYHPSEPEYHKVCLLQGDQPLVADLKHVYLAPTEETALSGNDGYHEKMGQTPPGLETDPLSAGDFL